MWSQRRILDHVLQKFGYAAEAVGIVASNETTQISGVFCYMLISQRVIISKLFRMFRSHWLYVKLY
jgi:hypothetical protein